VTAQATIQFVPPAAGSITIVKTATHGDATFSFASSVPGAATFGLTTQSGSATRSFPGLSPATYTFTEANLPREWKLSTLTCSGDTGGVPTLVDLAGRTATIGLDGGEAITCTFGDVFDGTDDTTNQIAAFLVHRLARSPAHRPCEIWHQAGRDRHLHAAVVLLLPENAIGGRCHTPGPTGPPQSASGMRRKIARTIGPSSSSVRR